MIKCVYYLFVLHVIISGPAVAAEPDWSQSKVSHTDEKTIDVFYSKTCGCCKKWMSHLKQHGFTVNPKPVPYMDKIKKQYGIKGEYSSCHTGVIGGYLIEGHVPADDIKTLLRKKPDIKGLSVPAMPVGTPGMEHGDHKDPFYVITLPKEGEPDIFKAYKKY